MTKVKQEQQEELPLEAMLLQCKKDKYKISYAALRWAKEIKQKENLPEPIPHLIPRAMREILLGKVSLKEIEKLPMVVKVSTAPAPAPAPAAPTSTPTIKLKDQPEETKEEAKEEPKEEAKEAPKKEAKKEDKAS